MKTNFSSAMKPELPEWMNVLIGELHNPENFTKSTSEIIGLVGYSYSYVASMFNKHLGCPFNRYFNLIKIDYAKRRLIDTDNSITEIAGQLGFVSLSYFNRLFKSAVGCSPSAFRKMNRRDLQ